MTERNIGGARVAASLLLTAAKNGGAFSAVSGRSAAREQMLRALECSAFDSEGAASAIELASQGDRDARVAVHTAIARFIAINEPLPLALRAYLLRLLDVGWVGPAKRGVNPNNDLARNQWICAAIAAVTPYGFQPTRNTATSGTESACSIVAEELEKLGENFSEGAINSIWGDRFPSDQ